MVTAVIFDLDGVIVSTDHYHYLAWKRIADQEKIEFNEKINHKLRGVSRMQSLDIILENAVKKYSLEEKALLASHKNLVYLEYLETLTEHDILEGVSENIQALKNQGIKLAIGSSSRNAVTILTKLGILDRFEIIVDGNDVTRSKPAPDIFLLAAKRLGVEPSECIVIEDAHSGIAAAKDAKMFAFAISDAVSSELADYRAVGIQEIIELIHSKNMR